VEGIFIIIIVAGIGLLLIAIQIKNIVSPKPKKKTSKKKNKYYNPQNNYFRNNPEHVDITHEYIESLWDELKKK
jgi:hypothetical protein